MSRLLEFWRERRLLILFVTALLLLTLTFLAVSPLFRLQEVVLNRLYFVERDAVLLATELEAGQHLFRNYGGSLHALLTGRYLALEAKLKASFPEFKEVVARLNFPSKINLTISERIPIAFLQAQDSYVLIDRDGVVCGITAKAPLGLPTIAGINVIGMTLGQAIIVDAPATLDQCVAIMSAIVEADLELNEPTPLLPQVVEIRASGYHRISLKIIPSNTVTPLLVNCSKTDYLKGHFLWLAEVLKQGILQPKLPGSLDLSGKHQIFTPEQVQAEGHEPQFTALPVPSQESENDNE